jgi:hypothetical protein
MLVGRTRLGWLVSLAAVLASLGLAASAWASPGTISTVAGDGTAAYSGDGGAATSGELNTPQAVAVDSGGDLLIADTWNHTVRIVAAASCSSGCPYGLSSMTRGDIYTVAGSGTQGFSGDGGPAVSAELDLPEGVAVDSSGNLLIADFGSDVVRLVAAASCSSGCPYGLARMTKGDIYTVVGDGAAGYSGDNGPATSAQLSQPVGVAIDAGGNLLIADGGNQRVRMVAAAACSSACPYGLSSTTKGDIYTVAGDGTPGYSGDGGAATSAELSNPAGVAVDAAGDLLIADLSNGRVRFVAAASCSSGCPYGLASTTKFHIYTVAGGGGTLGDNGPATSAKLNQPSGVALDRGGNLLIADELNNRVRLVAAASCSSGCPYGRASMTKADIYTVAGDGTAGYAGDGGAATSAELDFPSGVAIDQAGDLLIADTANNRVRLVVQSVASPALSIVAPAAGTAASEIASSAIQASLTSGAVPSGTITFKVFGPQATAPTDCAGGTPVGTASVSGNGSYSPGAGFTPSSAGDYWWYASYDGDSNNKPATSTCGGAMAETAVGPASPSVSVSAPGAGTAGSVISASSISGSLSGGASPSGTITFKVFGPQATAPTDCAGGTPVGTASVSGNGSYSPGAGFTPSSAGDYWWYASYDGDSNNTAAGSACGATMRKTVVAGAVGVPRLSALAVSPHRLSLAGRKAGGRCVKPTRRNKHHKRCRRPITLEISYTLNTAASVSFTLTRATPGRKVAGRCVKQTTKNKRHRRCRKMIPIKGSVSVEGRAGANTFTFTATIGSHALGSGRYELTATPSAGGQSATPQSVWFKLVG